MNYKIRIRNGKHCIYEIGTDTIIYRSKDLNAVKELCKNLNMGGGFNGFTPNFFCFS